MSMSDALRFIRDKVPWLTAELVVPAQASAVSTVLQDMAELVRMASVIGVVVDRQSATWAAVSSWAATELLEIAVKQESATDEKAAALRARSRTLRDLLEMDARPRVVTFEKQSPDTYIS